MMPRKNGATTRRALTPKEVSEIRDLFYSEKESARQLAIKYNVAQGTVHAIVKYKTYKDVP
jgi:hypothetical protein